jgi:hypothetical protein
MLLKLQRAKQKRNKNQSTTKIAKPKRESKKRFKIIKKGVKTPQPTPCAAPVYLRGSLVFLLIVPAVAHAALDLQLFVQPQSSASELNMAARAAMNENKEQMRADDADDSIEESTSCGCC